MKVIRHDYLFVVNVIYEGACYLEITNCIIKVVVVVYNLVDLFMKGIIDWGRKIKEKISHFTKGY